MRKVSKEERKKYESIDNLKEKFLIEMSGFSRIFNFIHKSKKPVVGHNVFQDLLRTYHQFVSPLPETYSRFKSDLHSFFPEVYDTKFICFELSRLVREDHPHLEGT